MTDEFDGITVKGAREHNLKNINLEIPRYSLTVITGLILSGVTRRETAGTSNAPSICVGRRRGSALNCSVLCHEER